jgi:hypothetical protein
LDSLHYFLSMGEMGESWSGPFGDLGSASTLGFGELAC